MPLPGFLSNLKEKFSTKIGTPDQDMSEEKEDEYVELGSEGAPMKEEDSKIIVRPFVLEDFEDIRSILDELRTGHTIALVNIQPLKDKDIVELKRAINKLKKTCDAVQGDIAGFGDDWICVTPSFAKIHRSSETADVEDEQ